MSEQNKNQVTVNPAPQSGEQSLAIKETTAPVNLSGNNIFSNSQSFQLAGKMAQWLASGTVVPKEYQGNVGNCLIAIDMSTRLGVPPLMVMQNLYVVNGRPAWSSQYIIAMINNSKKYTTELQFELTGAGDNMECFAFAEDKNGHKVVGPTITMKMAKDEGWLNKTGSKWKTMPEVMMRYRAASFFGRLNCPDMIMGIYTVDEVVELDENDFSIAEQIVVTEESVKAEIAENANGEVVDIESVESSDEENGDSKAPSESDESTLKSNVAETPYATDGEQQTVIDELP